MAQKRRDERAGECARARDAAGGLAPQDWPAALRIAEAISIPWYRVQAMAAVAVHAPETHVESILKRAVEVAKGGHDAYQRLAVLAWVVQAAAARERGATASAVAWDVVRSAGTITPSTSRAAALESLLPRVLGLGEDLVAAVANAALDAAQSLVAEPHKRCQKLGKWHTRNVARGLLDAPDKTLATRVLGGRFSPEQVARLLGQS